VVSQQRKSDSSKSTPRPSSPSRFQKAPSVLALKRIINHNWRLGRTLPTAPIFMSSKKFTPAHALVRTWLALELVSRLERFVYDPLESPAIVIRGLPVDAYAPPTEKDCLLRKAGNYASETLLVGISGIVGQPFQRGYPDPSSSEMEILIRDIYSVPEHDNEVHYSHRRDCVSEFPHVVSCRIPNMSSKP
jgi:hypothetical protein